MNPVKFLEAVEGMALKGCIKLWDTWLWTSRTTPDEEALQRFLSCFKDASSGVRIYSALEVVLVVNYTRNIVFLMSKPCFNGWPWSFVSTLSEEFMSLSCHSLFPQQVLSDSDEITS